MQTPPDRTPAAPEPPKPIDSADRGANAGRRYASEQLLGRHSEVEIQHGESIYRLRLTALGKLILTK